VFSSTLPFQYSTTAVLRHA